MQRIKRKGVKKMKEKRMAEIALVILRYQLRKHGLHIEVQSLREAGNIAKASGIPLSELKEFGKKLYDEFITELMQ